MELTNPGLAEDVRSQIDKDKDYIHAEVAPQAILLKWNRGIEGAPIYSVRDQDGSGSCVSQAIAKALETITGVVQSAHPVYRRRANYPSLGMWLQDGGNIVRQLGTTSEVLDPSQRLNETQMNEDIFVETPLKEAIYITADFKDINAIATAIETQKHCVITFNGRMQEYAYTDKPTIIPGNLDCAHAICGVYYFTDENGEKCILIDESWGPNNIRRRIITETYLKARGTGAMYFIPTPPLPGPQKPVYRFLAPLAYGDAGSLGVRMLQDVLKYEGLFPINVISSGYFGEITRKAVYNWQIKHNVAPMSELIALQGRRVGEKSLLVLNNLYN